VRRVFVALALRRRAADSRSRCASGLLMIGRSDLASGGTRRVKEQRRGGPQHLTAAARVVAAALSCYRTILHYCAVVAARIFVSADGR
jgi:hypothetical protein